MHRVQNMPYSAKLSSQLTHRHNVEGDALCPETLRYVDRTAGRNWVAIS